MMASSITINSNLAALNAQRRLGLSTQSVQQSFTRLSSGLRINRASDDVAGLAISESLKVDARVYTQGVRNLNDGLSALNIADSAIESLTNIVIRLEELAEQAANGTLGSRQRDALDQEAQVLSREYFRIARSAKFNGQQLLDGNIGDLQIQAAYGANGGIVAGFGGAIGTGSFGAARGFVTGAFPRSLTLGDLNGDGVEDLVTANSTTAAVSAMLGNGDGSFRARASFATGTQPLCVTLGDLNSDGVLDVVSADEISNQTSVMLGNGDGSFRARATFATGTDPQCVTLGDLNGDGALDIVTTISSRVSVMLGNGDGNFRACTSFAMGAVSNSITLGDLNLDGVLDVIVADTVSDTVSVMLGNGDGKFRARTSFTTGGQPFSIALGDVNGDELLDLVAAGYDANEDSVILGNGDGTFRANTSFSSDLHSLTLGDLNGDGALDVIGVAYSSDTASVILGNGDGSFRASTSFATGNGPRGITVGDLNGDGVLDMVAGAFIDNATSVFLATTKDGVSPLLPFDLTTLAGARQVLPVFKQKLSQLSAQRGEIGAFQARVGVAINTALVSVENFTAAASQITDADVAEESAQLVKNQILQQAGTAVLAQANQAPALALALLRSG
jgi:flagellin-like hook-associated protein FlgL